MIFKPKIRQPKRRSATEGEGEKGSAADGRSVSTAGGAATATGSAAGMMHRRHPSLPNLADSRRLRFDLLHRLGIDNSNTSELVGFRSRLPPGAVGGSSRTGRTSLLGDVASHEVPLKFGEYHIDEDSGPSAWKRFFGLGRAEDEEGDEEGRGGEDEDEDEQDEESKHLQMEVGGEKEEDGGARDGAARDGAATSGGGGSIRPPHRMSTKAPRPPKWRASRARRPLPSRPPTQPRPRPPILAPIPVPVSGTARSGSVA